MFVTAVSTPANPHWRWRISTYTGAVVDESRDEFTTIAAALAAGRTRAATMTVPDESAKPATWSRWRFGRRALLIGGLTLAAGIAHAEVPTAKDFAECNQEARTGLSGQAASPNRKDHAGAEQARSAAADGGERADRTGRVTESPDPQIAGMDGAGAKDPAYRAAYRVCMRKKGF
jgi:hypothetical protein